jgi:ribosomal protein S18 acetylase RimI-like enzyme
MGITIERLTAASPAALWLLQEYYEAIGVQVRDTPDSIALICSDPASGVWLASLDGEAVGCVVLRPLPQIPGAAECKRLYVQPSARGHRIADRLMDALESFAVTSGLAWIYLDSKDDLLAAIRLYRKRGYTDCERYNDNPQATLYLRKRLTPIEGASVL